MERIKIDKDIWFELFICKLPISPIVHFLLLVTCSRVFAR
jgi:hypothetical protein